MAHQLFGNLVYLAWWDQLWLKEGFVTWVSYFAVDTLLTELDIWAQVPCHPSLVTPPSSLTCPLSSPLWRGAWPLS